MSWSKIRISVNFYINTSASDSENTFPWQLQGRGDEDRLDVLCRSSPGPTLPQVGWVLFVPSL